MLLGAVFLFLAMRTPVEERTTFFILMCLTAIFMPMSSANVIATIYDVTLPEVRSTTMAVEYLIENSGAALAPLLTGIIADAFDLQTAILSISITAWLLCFVIYLGALTVVEGDILSLRAQLRQRAEGQLSVRPVQS